MACTNGYLGLEEQEDESGRLEPFFYDESEVVAEAAAAAERHRREAEEKAREMEEFARRRAARDAVIDRILEYDPKQGCVCYTRFHRRDFSTFNIDEECVCNARSHQHNIFAFMLLQTNSIIHSFSCNAMKSLNGFATAAPLGPMRHTDKTNVYGQKKLNTCDSANILSVKIVSSDVGFPINVYGTVIARDSLDQKCIYLFRRHREDCQLINTEEQSLILTGPTRALVLIGYIYFEVDLKIKDDQDQQNDKELSKGLLMIDGVLSCFKDKIEAESKTLDSRLSTVEVKYAVVKYAVEATLEIKVLEGDFYGEITACTTSIQDRIVLHDCKEGGVVTCGCSGSIQLWRRVVAVGLKEMLLLTIVTQAHDDADVRYTRTLDFTPRDNGAEEIETACGVIKMHVKVNWSLFST